MDQHCWSCRKRRIVCDFGKPECAKCKRAGVDCPGYGKQKPLQWLSPGRVTSKERKRPRVAIKTELKAVHNGIDVELNEDPHRGKTIISTGSKLEIQVKVEAEVEVFTGIVPRAGIKDETTDIVQATFYYNKTLYPVLLNYYEMVPSPYVVSVPLEMLHHLPVTMRHCLVSLSLGYRLHRQELSSTIAWPKMLVHRGSAIKEINEIIGRSNMQVSKRGMTRKQKDLFDTIIACVIVFLSVEIQYCASMDWRYHIDAMADLIATRGGLTKLWHEAPLIRSALVHFVLIQNFASSTSPVTKQTSLRPFNQLLSMPEEMHEDIFSFCLCPLSLFEEIAFISRVRVQSVKHIVDFGISQKSAAEVFMRVGSFSPVEWAASQPGVVEDLETLATVYHCAVMLYCILSLQHLLPTELPLENLRAIYGDRLLECLSSVLPKGCRLHYFITWPVAVAGVEAVKRGPGTQALIDAYLTDMSRQSGTCSALMARAALRSFWASGRTEWDDCFCKLFAFQC